MEQDSCQEPDPSSELDEDDSAFAKTPIRADSASQEGEDADDTSDSVSSNGSPHCNDHGARTYFHVWGDMLTCNQMGILDKEDEAADEAAAAAAGVSDGVPESNSNLLPKPLSIDTSLPCPLLQFGPIPRRRPRAKQQQPQPSPPPQQQQPEASIPDAPDAAVGCADSHHRHNPDGGGSSERCCDFSVVAAKNKERIRREEKLRRLERRKLLRY